MFSGKKIYIADKITDTTDSEERFKKLEMFVKLNNGVAINPFEVVNTHFKTFTYNEIMKVCFSLIDICDIVLMGELWESSKGAIAEKAFAKALRKKVTHFKKYKLSEEEHDINWL